MSVVGNSSRAGVWLNLPTADVPDPLKTWATHWQPVNAYRYFFNGLLW